MSTFIAINFETANHNRNNVCAVGVAAGEDGRIALVRSFLVRPHVSQFVFSKIHGIRWKDVRDAPSFSELWPTLLAWINDVEFIAAHNASFDRGVLQECCATFRLRVPQVPFVCTVQLAHSQ